MFEGNEPGGTLVHTKNTIEELLFRLNVLAPEARRNLGDFLSAFLLIDFGGSVRVWNVAKAGFSCAPTIIKKPGGCLVAGTEVSPHMAFIVITRGIQEWVVLASSAGFYPWDFDERKPVDLKTILEKLEADFSDNEPRGYPTSHLSVPPGLLP